MWTEIDLNESEMSLNECDTFSKRTEIGFKECEHFLKANLDRDLRSI